MKSKLFIAVAFIFVVNVAIIWWFHRPSQPRADISPRGKSGSSPVPDLVPVNAAKMSTVTTWPMEPSGSPRSVASDWEAVLLIIDAKADYGSRLRAIDNLSAHLSEDDVVKLQQFLVAPDPLDESQEGQVLKNRLMDALCALNPPPAGYGDTLAKIFHDLTQNEVLRNYAIQHLAAYYEQMNAQPQNGPALKAAQKVLWEAAREPGGSIEGTALLALKRLSMEYKDFDKEQIAATALRMAVNPVSSEMTHITAYQVCGQLGVKDALPAVIQAAQNGETISLKMSAVAALGALGGADQAPYLKQILEGTEERLKPAAKYALAQISSRQHPTVSQN